jgi:hypothetical protein
MMMEGGEKLPSVRRHQPIMTRRIYNFEIEFLTYNKGVHTAQFVIKTLLQPHQPDL